MRSSGWIEFSALDIWRCINYWPTCKEWNVDAEMIKYVRKMGVGAYTVLNRSQKVMVVASRDFVLDFLTFQRPDGVTFIVISSNHDLYEEFPAPKGVMRAEAPVGGWIVKPDPENPNRCFCQLMIELDFGGILPGIVVKTAFRNQGYQLHKLKKAIPKMYKHY